ncbi:hypothetical protein [Pedobacter hartonius]|uniref:Uncharacterized protein n=1 Tax=Pedobacter hartonius TaxID=425514 RepID=A0A1H4AVS5_9SPHI|nr:hypothetical protein [Pedobacter hartonius]SEA39947.1 hypothetical protein SAMN05443550_103108 [Pedobacter hartonius]
MLLEEIISKSNMHQAYERVVAGEVRSKWPLIKSQLNQGWGTYFKLSEVKSLFSELDAFLKKEGLLFLQEVAALNTVNV